MGAGSRYWEKLHKQYSLLRCLQPSALSVGSPSGLWMVRYLVYLLSGTEFALRLQDVTGASAQQ